MEIIFIFMTTLLMLVHTQDIAFPGKGEEHERPGKIPPRLDDNRIPIHIPGRCPPNQLLYPGDQKEDWTCDCGPGFIYYPPADGCHAAYRKGPCADKKILVLPKGKVIPECVDNPCDDDGFVKYNGKCYELNKDGGPCKPASAGGGVFSVNKTTLALECLTDTSPLNLINFPTNCPPGSRRSTSICRPEY